MYIDYTGKKIDSMSHATLAQTREQQSAPNASIICKITRIDIT